MSSLNRDYSNIVGKKKAALSKHRICPGILQGQAKELGFPMVREDTINEVLRKGCGSSMGTKMDASIQAMDGKIFSSATDGVCRRR